MFNLSINRNIIIKLSIAFLLTTLIGCENGNTDPNSYINVSVKSSDSGINTQNKSDANNPSFSQDGSVNILPAGITRIDFNITDSNNEKTSASLTVGSKTETINIRVAPNRDLVIDIEALTGDTISFQGQTEISALRPGQSSQLNVSLNQVGTPNTSVILSINPVGSYSQLEGNNSREQSFVKFDISLSSPPNGNVTADITFTDISATGGVDYSNRTTGILITPSSPSMVLDIPVTPDTEVENDETFMITLSNVSANAVLGNTSAIGAIISDDYPVKLNDTGVTLCGDYSSTQVSNSNIINCNITGASATQTGADIDGDPVPAGQDAFYGRDAAEYAEQEDGNAGFNFSRLDSKGALLTNPNYATNPWACVHDNNTGLTWEVKTNSGLQDATSTYSWLNKTGINDGGTAGTENAGTCSNGSGCDTEKYVADINSFGLCGLSDWRLPDVSELLNIVDNSREIPATDINFFPNTPATFIWSSTPVADARFITFAHLVNFYWGESRARDKSQTHRVRLVSSSTPVNFIAPE